MINVKYCGPALDYSGYGEAVRHDLGALQSAGIPFTTQIPKYCLEISEFGRLGELAIANEQKQLDYKVKIIHTTPNVYHQFIEPGKYNIGRVFWETDKLPEAFASKCNLVQEIWTGSEFNKQAIIKAGVKKPIYIIPEAIDIFVPSLPPYTVTYTDTYKFYSIFEWTERKNWKALLEAYYREFQNDEKVSLTLKTYVDNFTEEKKAEIQLAVRAFKRTLQLEKYPIINFYTNLMDRYQIYRFHTTFDCFVSSHRGEGWGIPQMEALLMKKPMISTNKGGIHEYLTDGESAFLVDCEMIPVNENTRNPEWYAKDQNWAKIGIDDLRARMRWCYEHQKEAAEIGIKGSKVVQAKFSLEAVGRQMIKRLNEIF